MRSFSFCYCCLVKTALLLQADGAKLLEMFGRDPTMLILELREPIAPGKQTLCLIAW